MPDSIPVDSVGLVSPQFIHIDTPLSLESGRMLMQYDLVYETYGEPVSYTHLTLPTKRIV